MPKGRTEETFGKVVVEWGLASRSMVDECLLERAKLQQTGEEKRLGEMLIERGIITKAQALRALKETHRIQGDHKCIGNFELLEKLGEGAMGIIYKARQNSMDRIVALKLLPRALSRDETLKQRFLREARTVARFHHPNIICGYEVGEANGYQFFAMEFVEGGTLEDRLNKYGPFDNEYLTRVLMEITQGLQHAHEFQIIHRDIKPTNIMLSLDGTAKLADLGLAASLDATQTSAQLTGTGNIVGTPYYMAPEQASGLTALDVRTDIYALGATAFHLATGRPPFEGDSMLSIISRRLHEDPPDAREVNPAITKRLSGIIRKMMAREPGERYQNCDLLLNDLSASQTSLGAKFFGKAEKLRKDVSAIFQRTVIPAPDPVTSFPGGTPSPAMASGDQTDQSAFPGSRPSPTMISVMHRIRAFLNPPMWFRWWHAACAGFGMVVFLAGIWGVKNRELFLGPPPPEGLELAWEGAPSAQEVSAGRKIQKEWQALRKLCDAPDRDSAEVAKALKAFMEKYKGSAYAALARREQALLSREPEQSGAEGEKSKSKTDVPW